MQPGLAIYLKSVKIGLYETILQGEDYTMSKKENSEDVTVHVDKNVRNVAIAGVLIVGIIYGCNTYRKVLQWRDEEE